MTFLKAIDGCHCIGRTYRRQVAGGTGDGRIGWYRLPIAVQNRTVFVIGQTFVFVARKARQFQIGWKVTAFR
jgi:hypothetical protein